jgi:hypothetical protein
MAILGGFPVVDSVHEIVDPFIDTRTFTFRSLDGQVILPCTGDELIARWGIQGLDVPPRENVQEAIYGQEGADLVDIKIGPREYFIPLFLGSNSSHLDYLNKRGDLRSLFNHRKVDYKAAGGTFDLVANSIKGERALRSTYVDGMNGDWEQDSSGIYWESFGLNLLAVRPHWYGGRWTTPVIRRPESGAAWFGHFPGRLSSSRTLTAPILVTVLGDIDSYARIDLVGPADDVLITSDSGLYVSIPDGLADGETAVINTNPRPSEMTASFDGVEDWGRIDPETRWAPLPTGDQSIVISIGGLGANSSAVVSGPSEFESPW